MSGTSTHTLVTESDVPTRERRGGGAASRDISGALGTIEMAIRVWTFAPGDEMAHHRHRTQEEAYRLLSGGPQEVVIGDRVVTMNDGDWLRVHRDTPRHIRNHSGRTATWLTVGAPFGEGIRDGIRLDPETGRELPR